MCNRPCYVKWELGRTITNPLNCKARVTTLSFITCLKGLIKTKASSLLNLLHHRRVHGESILHCTHSEFHIPTRTVHVTEQFSNNLAQDSVHFRDSLSDFTGLWSSPNESFSSATYPATASQSKAGSTAGEKGHESQPWAGACLACISFVSHASLHQSCPSLTCRQLWLLHNHSFLAYRQANLAEKGTG